MSFEPIKKKRVYEYVIERIKASIELGEIKPGDKLPSERDMAKLLNVSRAAIREALSVMESFGMLEIKTGIGVFLIEDQIDILLDKLDIILSDRGFKLIEVLEVRQGIETQAAYLAAQRALSHDLKSIEEALNKLEARVKEGKLAAEEDHLFHLSVVAASKNHLLIKMLSLISDHFVQGLHKSREQSLMVPGRSKLVLHEHQEIFEAIISRNADLAREKMWFHLEHVRSRFK